MIEESKGEEQTSLNLLQKRDPRLRHSLTRRLAQPSKLLEGKNTQTANDGFNDRFYS